jgi:polyisoprenoid-binding protein YceI
VTAATDHAPVPGYRAGTWKADPERSTIEFGIRQVVGRVRGRITGYDVTIVTGDRLTDSSVMATIDLASIDTGNPKRDAHLRSPQLLDVGKHPTITYRSLGVQHADDGPLVEGRLALHGAVQVVPLALEMKGFGTNAAGREVASFRATAQLSRRDFGLDIPMAGGGVVVGDKVSVDLDIEAVRAA